MKLLDVFFCINVIMMGIAVAAQIYAVFALAGVIK